MVDVMSLYVWLYPNNKNKNPNNFASVDVRARSALRLLVIIYSKQHFGAGGQVLVLFLPARPALVHCEVFVVAKTHISGKICTTYIFKWWCSRVPGCSSSRGSLSDSGPPWKMVTALNAPLPPSVCAAALFYLHYIISLLHILLTVREGCSKKYNKFYIRPK